MRFSNDARFRLILSLLMLCAWAPAKVFAYNSNVVGAAAGKYYGAAIAVDYFFEKTRCENTQFGMRSKTKSMREFVYEDIDKMLSPYDRREFLRAKDPVFIASIEGKNGNAMVRFYREKLRESSDAVVACMKTEYWMLGMVSYVISEFYLAAKK